MASIINASTSGAGGVITTADASGELQLQSGGTTVLGVNYTGGAARIQADWSQSTFTSRSAIQTSTLNSGTIVNFIPNGTGTGSVIDMYDKDSFVNSTRFRFGINASECYISQNTQGTGTFLPFNIYTGGSEQMRIATDGTITSTLGGMQVRSGTAVASTSGTAIDFTGIPSWVKRITVMFSGVSLSGTSVPLIQLGDSGGIENTGYLGCGTNTREGTDVNIDTSSSTIGFRIGSGVPSGAVAIAGAVTITNISGNIWVASGTCASTTEAVMRWTAGNKTLSDVLTQVRITTVNGTDAFDAGSINILYE